MTIIYRVRFVRPCTEATAREAVEGVNGGSIHNVRTADDGNHTTAWFSIAVNDDASDEAICAFVEDVNAELLGDSRIGGFDSREV